MKKIGLRSRIRIIARNNRKLSRRHRRNRKKRNQLTLSKSIVKQKFKNPHTSRTLTKNVIIPPKALSLTDHFEETARFFIELRDSFKRHHSRALKIDLANLDILAPAAALILASEIDRWRRTERLRLRIDEPNKWKPEILNMLAQIGFFKTVGATNTLLINSAIDSDRIILEMSSGRHAQGQAAQDFRQKLEEFFGKISNSNLLFRALTEAMTNVLHHAYPQSNATDDRNRWWMTGACINNELSVIFADHGVGIPRTLDKHNTIEALRTKLHLGRADSDQIYLATLLGRTQTKKPYRGNGLRDMQDLIRKAPFGGRLRILSLNGEYIYTKSNDKEHIQKLDHGFPLSGTLIQWVLRTSKYD